MSTARRWCCTRWATARASTETAWRKVRRRASAQHPHGLARIRALSRARTGDSALTQTLARACAPAGILALEAREERDFDKYKALASGERTKAMWAATGDPQGAMWSVGQGAGLVEDVPTCEELVARVVREAEECLRAAAACAAPTRARL